MASIHPHTTTVREQLNVNKHTKPGTRSYLYYIPPGGVPAGGSKFYFCPRNIMVGFLGRNSKIPMGIPTPRPNFKSP